MTSSGIPEAVVTQSTRVQPVAPRIPGFLHAALRWFCGRLLAQKGLSPSLPDDARENLRQDRLLAQDRLDRLRQAVRPPL